MSFKPLGEILSEADRQNLRRALVVTALPIEMRAVRAHLEDLGSTSGRDGTIYECGRFSATDSDWIVVVAQSGAGNHPAQIVVTYAHFDFQRFETLLFIGVGGSRKADAPIGCVIAANRIYDPYGGKFGEEGFSARPRVSEVDHRLVQVALKVERDDKWQERIRAPLKVPWPPAGAYPQPYPPGAFIAPIVSVEAVSADPKSELERHIALHCGDAHAVEMEGYGTVFAANRERTPCIIVRGVSDMASEKTPAGDALRQPVAAAHAAAFGFELLSVWGQTVRPLSRPPIQANIEHQSALPATNVASNLPASRLVLNFEGVIDDFPPDKIDAIIQTLRDITGNRSIKAVGSEPGSVRLLVEAHPEDLAKIGSIAFRKALAEKHNVDLLSILDEAEFREVQRLKELLGPASEDLMAWPRNLPDGTWIDRPELAQLMEIVESQEDSRIVLLGPPGSGKSSLLATFSATMVARGWPVMGIKADLLNPQVQSEDGLQDQLGLPEPPSIVLERISALQPVVLVIDQLDALAGYVDLRTGRLSVLLNLARKLGQHPNIHIVLSARTFEFEHDVRLRSIDAESIRLELPAWHTVLAILGMKGIKADGWPCDAQEVLRSPQALATFLRLRSQMEPEPFLTYQAMLNRLWSERILQAHDGPRLARLALEIAGIMAEEESLWLAAARFDEQALDLHRLESMDILTTFGSGGSIGFSHQTLFEHALARSFVRGKGRLSVYVLSREASLFIRPKLWAALTYLRDVELSTYEAELVVIWEAKNLRRHLRYLLIDFMGQQAAPSDREATLMAPALALGTDRQIAFRAITGSPGWFERMGRSLVAEAMTEGQESAWLAVDVLSQAWSFEPGQVVALVRAQWITNSEFDYQSWTVLEACLKWTDELSNLAATILARSEIQMFRVDHLIATIGVDQPLQALRLVRAKLDNDLKVAKTEAKRRCDALPVSEGEKSDERAPWSLAQSPDQPLSALLRNSRDWDSLAALAVTSPSDFLEILWPWYHQIFAALREFEEGPNNSIGFPLSYGIDFGLEAEEALGPPGPALLAGLRVAIEQLAEQDSASFLAWVDANEGDDVTPTQWLIAHGLATHPELFAQRALKFLLADHRRFILGFEDFSYAAQHLIRAASPFWAEEDLVRFEKTAMTYAPSKAGLVDAKSRQDFSGTVRRIRLALLKALPSDRTSSAVQRLIAEETRAFPLARAVEADSAVWIGSPMETQAISAASDDDVINAFRTLPDSTAWHHPRNWMVGGNIQLSRAFADFAKNEPDRAIHLLAKFEPDFGERAAGYALDAMAEVADGRLLVSLFIDLAQRGFSSEEFRGSAARGISRLVKREIPIDDEAVAILEAWLKIYNKSDPDDRKKITPQMDQDERNQYEVRSVLWPNHGFSVLPQGNFPVLEALTCVLLARPDHDRLVQILRAHMLRSEELRVWQALLGFFIYLRPTNKGEREEILTVLFSKFPELARTQEAARLLAHAQWWALDFVRQTIETWPVLGDRMLGQAYGELVALIAIAQPHVQWASESLRHVVELPELHDARVGVAFSAANLWNAPERRQAAAEVLTTLIPQADTRVWKAVLDLFRVADELIPDQTTVALLQVISDYIRNAGRLDATFMIERLETLLPYEAPLVGKIAQGIVSNWREDSEDVRAGRALDAPLLVDLAITLHRLGPSTREVGTSLFEELLAIDAYSARQTLDEIDNRFKAQGRPARPRLPRRRRTMRRGNP